MDHKYIESNLQEKMNDFISELKKILDDDRVEKLKHFEELNKDEFGMKDNLYKFHEKLMSNDLFNLFTRCKIKLFSSKTDETNDISESLFGYEISLKTIFNNRSSNVKKNLWRYLHLFYLLIESSLDNGSEERKKMLTDLLSQKLENDDMTKEEIKSIPTDELSSKVKEDILNVDVNDSTNNLIDDIVSSFQSSLDVNSENPFDCIMDITQKITEKYKDKLDSGEIELDKMMGGIQNSIPGMGGLMGKKDEPQEKVVIDENFSTDQVDLGEKDKEEGKGFKLSGMMKMMNSMNGKGGGPNLGGLMNVMKKMNTIQTEDEAKELKVEMDTFLEKELGVDMDKFNDTLNKIESKQNDNKNQNESVSNKPNLNTSLQYNQQS